MTSSRRQVVAVASGKGGVGKSTVSVNLAIGLHRSGLRVGLIDADLYGPDIPRMLNLTRRQPSASLMLWSRPGGTMSRPEPIERFGVKVMSTQFLLGEEQAFSPPADLGNMLFRRFLDFVDWGDTEVLVVDLPPGTSDLQQQLVAIPDLAGVVVVVTPQDVAHLDAKKVLSMLESAGVRVLGGVENMSALRCPCCNTSIDLFPATPEERTIWASGVPRLVRIPFSSALAESDQAGVPILVDRPTSDVGLLFDDLAEKVRRAMEFGRRSRV